MSIRIAFIGLGVMGYAMATHLRKAGHDITVYNRTESRTHQWVSEHGGAYATTPALAARNADVVCACVGNDDDLYSVTIGGNGAFAAMKTNAIFVDHTTTSATIAKELYTRAQALQLHFMDAPVSGGQVGAENGQLTIMCGGDEPTFDCVKPVISAYAKAVTRMGQAGAGQLTKMVNQICIGGILQSLSEALAFGDKAGLDLKKVLEVIGQGAAQSWQMHNRGATMVDDQFDFGFAVDLMRKDLGLVLDEARRNGATLTSTAMIDQLYADVQAMGGGRWDTSSLIRRLR